MIISHKHKFVFFANSKCASSTIETILAGYNDDKRITLLDWKNSKRAVWRQGRHTRFGREHIIPSKVHYQIEEVLSEYFTFMFCRNPWDWVLSQFCWNFRYAANRMKVFNKKKFYRIEAFLSTSKHSAKYQSDYLWDRDGKLCIDYIGRFENLQEDFNTICDKIGIPEQELPHKNKNKHNHYTEYYDDETKEIVAKKYRKDIEYFGYKFGE